MGRKELVLIEHVGQDAPQAGGIHDREQPRAILARLGAHYHSGALADMAAETDVIIEYTGHPQLLLDAGDHEIHNRITCLTGVSAAGPESSVDMGYLNRRMVLNNGVLFGSVNANRRHYEEGAQALAKADPAWLARLVTREVPLDQWEDALTRQPDDVKVAIEFAR